MRRDRFEAITARYATLRLAVVGDFCLDRYLEIDPRRAETSIETGLPVYNVINVRAQPGAAGTILNNLVALGIGCLHPVGFCGEDGEGSELRSALAQRPGVNLQDFVITPERRTFTYCKPLILEPGKAPRELNRLDTKNWSPTPSTVSRRLADGLLRLAPQVDAMIVLDQVDLAHTGVVTPEVLEAVDQARQTHPGLFIVADGRRGLSGFPPVAFKMNRHELGTLLGAEPGTDVRSVAAQAATLARSNLRPVVVTLAEQGLLAAEADGRTTHLAALPTRGEIDIVGAGDSVTANLTAAMAAGASLPEALELANAAASIVIHQLGTTGTASVKQLRELVIPA
jgi:rfaE bifunctional protein kinase chain/domain